MLQELYLQAFNDFIYLGWDCKEWTISCPVRGGTDGLAPILLKG